MRKVIVAVAVLAVVAVSVGAYYNLRQGPVEPTVTTATTSSGDITDSVGATGTVQAVTTVQVGTQVSGTISELNADFNSLVRKGQILARLDPSLFQTQIEQARANLVRSQADVERLRVSLEDARTKLTRAQELAARNLVPKTDLEAAQVAVSAADAQVKSAQAQVTQAQAALNQNQVNLDHTVIAAPIDGIVISRNVDVGQTVAASMQAPTLFVLAADLTKMQVIASLDESDVGRIRPGQPVRFRVDAYPAEDFSGTVSQVRLQPQVVQNVVTYSTVIGVPNLELKLKPGMTANVNIEIARRTNVIRVPNAALRFRPTDEIYAALGQTPPPQGTVLRRQVTTGAGGERPAADNAPTEAGSPAVATGQQASADQRGPNRRAEGLGGGRAGFTDRVQSLPPDERERLLQRMRERGGAPGIGDRTGTGVGGRTVAPGPNESAIARNPRASTIDALFGPLPPVESMGRVWLYINKQLKPVAVRLGITDGQATELIQGDLQPGTELVTNVATDGETRPTSGGIGGFPFMGGNVRFRGGPGGDGGQNQRR